MGVSLLNLHDDSSQIQSVPYSGSTPDKKRGGAFVVPNPKLLIERGFERVQPFHTLFSLQVSNYILDCTGQYCFGKGSLYFFAGCLTHPPAEIPVSEKRHYIVREFILVCRYETVDAMFYRRACRYICEGYRRHPVCHRFHNLYLLSGAPDKRADGKGRMLIQ